MSATTTKTAHARSPRRLNPHHEALQSIPVDSNAPAPDSFSWKLWRGCQELAQAALNTTYVQGIAKGMLDPNAYGLYTVQDAVYSYHGANDYTIAEHRAAERHELEIAAFCRVHHQGYESYYKTMFKAWSIANPDALAPHEAMKAYIEHEENVTRNLDPIYTVVAMLPCDLLWAWLAEQLAPHNTPSNLYSFWIAQNTGFTGAYHLANFINAWTAQHPGEADWGRAFSVFHKSMACEVNAFLAACGEPALPPSAQPMPLHEPANGG